MNVEPMVEVRLRLLMSIPVDPVYKLEKGLEISALIAQDYRRGNPRWWCIAHNGPPTPVGILSHEAEVIE